MTAHSAHCLILNKEVSKMLVTDNNHTSITGKQEKKTNTHCPQVIYLNA